MAINEELFKATLEELEEVELAARLVGRFSQLEEETNRIKIGIFEADIKAIAALARRRGYNLPERGKS